MPLNETHHALLRIAAAREDRLLTMPDGLTTRARTMLIKALIGSGCVAEVAISADQPCWGEVEGEPIGLQITSAGLSEIGEKPEAPVDRVEAASVGSGSATAVTEPARRSPRAQTKLSRVIGLLQRGEGATLEDLIDATGWLPHSTRAALTGLRKRGYELERDRNADGKTLYRLAAGHGDAGPDQAGA